MAQPSLEKFTRRGIAAVIQPTPGTPATPDLAVDGVRLFDGSSDVESDNSEQNEDRPFFSGRKIDKFNFRAFIQGNFRIAPPVTPGDAADGTPSADIILRPGGTTKVLDAMAGTTRYNPISQGIPLTTAWWYHAGTRKRVFDARHGISALDMSIGQRYQGQVRIQGSFDDVDEEALPSITAPTAEGAIITSSNSEARLLLPGDVTLPVWAKQLSIDFNSQLQSKQFTELRVNSIDDRLASWTMRIARTAKADFWPWQYQKSGAILQATMRVIEADGRYTEQGIRGQVDGVSEVDIDGDYGWELTGPCVASDAGGDEFWIEFGTV